MGSSVFDFINMCINSLRSKQGLYELFSVISPYGLIYLLYPEEIPFYIIFFYILIFTVLVHFMYDIYWERKIKINMKILDSLGSKFTTQKEKIKVIQNDLKFLIENFKVRPKPEKFKQFSDKLENLVIKYGIKKKEKVDDLFIKMDSLEEDIFTLKEGNTGYNYPKNYKNLDYIILLTASFLSIVIFYPVDSFSSNELKLIFFLLFILLLLINVIYSYFQYVVLLIYIEIFKVLLSQGMIQLRKSINKYKVEKEIEPLLDTYE